MDLSFYREHGYQVLRGVIDRNVAATVRAFLVAEADKALDLLRESLGARSLLDLSVKIHREYKRSDFESIPRELRQTMSGHFLLRSRLSPVLWQIPRLPRLRAVLEQLLEDPELYMHMPPTARFVLPRNRHAAVPAHQDVSYSKHMIDFVTCWVPLVKVDDACGGVAVFEGSGHEPERLEEYFKTFWLHRVQTTGFHRIHCTMDVGDVLLLNRWIIHESMPNNSDRVCYNIDYRFFPSGDKSSKHVLDMQKWRVVEPPPGA